MNETYRSILDVLANDADITAMGGVASLTIDDVPSRQIKCNMAAFPIKIYPFGISQTASAGELNPNGYFAITVRFSQLARMRGHGDDFLAIGERIISLLHRSRHGGQSVFFSKNIIAHSSFILQNSNRRINVKMDETEMVQVIFFWTNPATVEELAAASDDTVASTSDSGTRFISLGVSSSSSSSAESTNMDALRAVSLSYELFP